MIRLKMHAMYDHFPELNPINDLEPHINCYSDTYVNMCTGPGLNIAMLLEPRSMIGPAYDWVEEHESYFRYIFTHDSKLLRLPQARMLNWADVWLTTDSEKTKGISICTSYKNWCPYHNVRLEIANYYKDRPKVDVFFGDWNNPSIPNVEARDYLEHYKFSIIVENDIDEFWYTEKLLNCFATKTVPIYIGATRISEVFNAEGIIQLKDDWQYIYKLIYDMDIDAAYEYRKEAIEDNFRRVDPWKVDWKKRFFSHYGSLLEELLND